MANLDRPDLRQLLDLLTHYQATYGWSSTTAEMIRNVEHRLDAERKESALS